MNGVIINSATAIILNDKKLSIISKINEVYRHNLKNDIPEDILHNIVERLFSLNTDNEIFNNNLTAALSIFSNILSVNNGNCSILALKPEYIFETICIIIFKKPDIHEFKNLYIITITNIKFD